ncbi:hypothetical protein SEA_PAULODIABOLI_42 [Microbacterium phage PauloDiaboli]|nr:hypothetical protein SEA_PAULODIABOLI_42 [Microbacterium phage PauloDiaboli]QWY83892.1 hypothetical protein SEA_A3WALLY_42 [Microbacterium phage A3Wally]
MPPFYGYSYLCPCGTILNTDNGLDYQDQLDFIMKIVAAHRNEHIDRMIGLT